MERGGENAARRVRQFGNVVARQQFGGTDMRFALKPICEFTKLSAPAEELLLVSWCLRLAARGGR
jgi:hypothetical protein